VDPLTANLALAPMTRKRPVEPHRENVGAGITRRRTKRVAARRMQALLGTEDGPIVDARPAEGILGDDEPLTIKDFEAISDTKFELIDGDLYIGGRCVGHGPLARGLLRVLARK
jgi:hypothetical protein